MKETLRTIWRQITTKRSIMFLGSLLVVSILYFLVPIAVFPDSLAYYSSAKILSGVDSLSTWNIVRGPTLPVVLLIFTSIFKNTMAGLLIGTYFFFAGTMVMIYVILNRTLNMLKASSRTKTVAVVVFILLVVLNPVLFGYFHALLTEFVATFMVIVSCLLSWAWLKADFLAQKFRIALFVIGFALLFVVIWFLKQPYLTIILFPLLIAGVLSVIRDFSIVNVLQRSVTIAVCIVCLLISVFAWRSFLVENGVDFVSANSTDDSYLSSGILKGISDAHLVDGVDVDEAGVQNNKFLSLDDKAKVTQIINGEPADGYSAVQLLNIKSPLGRSIDTVPVYQKNSTLGVSESIVTWASVATKHPLVVVDSYLSNYLAAVGLYDFKTDLKTGAMTPIKKLGLYGHENSAIGLFYSYHPTNTVANISDRAEDLGLVNIGNNLGGLTKTLIRSYGRVHCGIFIVMLLLLPFALGLAISKWKKELRQKFIDDKLVHAYELAIIIFGFTSMHIIFNIVLGAMIDRYIFITIPMIAFGYILSSAVSIEGRVTSNKKHKDGLYN